MNPTHRGECDAAGLRIGIVVSRFNEMITTRLLEGARTALAEHGASADLLTVVEVPGAWELPLAARRLAESGRFDALVCLGCVIRGETTHHLHVGGEAARGIAEISRSTGLPIGFGVLTTDTLAQAIERAGGREGNKGADAAMAASEMVHLLRKLR